MIDAPKEMPVLERLERRTEKKENGCWEYTGYRLKGYGRITFLKKGWYCHRLAWETIRGPIPAGLQVLHKCDNPPCWNPDHLFLGTDLDNKKDCHSKARHNIGTRNGHAKLDEQKIIEIRTKYGPGVTMQMLADEYHVRISRIYRIVRGLGWKHVNCPSTDFNRKRVIRTPTP